MTTLVLGLLLCKARKTLTQLATGHSVSALSRFFNEYRWSVDQIRQHRQEKLAVAIRHRYGHNRGRKPTLSLIIDDTVVSKWGKLIARLGRHYCSTQEKVGGCTDLDIKPQMIRRHYRKRWAVETFFQTSKHQFGLGDYQIRSWKGIERWIELVLLVYTLAALKRKEQMRWDEAKSYALQSLVPVIEEIHQGLMAMVWYCSVIFRHLCPFLTLRVPRMEFSCDHSSRCKRRG